MRDNLFMDVSVLYQIFLKYPVVCTDTRNIIPGSVFFALKGNNFNGNTFAAEALKQGCAYAVIDEDIDPPSDKYVRVTNVLEALQQLASYHRKQMPATIVALTGSNGKTTTKELLHAVLSQQFNCLATEGNLNNHIGVPLTLLRIKKEHQVAIVEMGANHQGEIDALCNIALPDMGMITNIGKAHLEGFGGPEGVLKAKTELYRHLIRNKKKILLNKDDDALVKETSDANCYAYGTNENTNLQGKMNDPQVHMSFQIKTNNLTWLNIQTQLTGSYNFYNALGAAAAGRLLGVSDENIKKGLEQYIPSNNRSQIEKRGTNTLILDAYNANPSSMKLAIENAAGLTYPNKLLLLGDMREMGPYAAEEHKKILDQLKQVKATTVLVGKEFYAFNKNYPYHFFENTTDALHWLQQNKPENSLVLLKGSRGIKLETLLPAL